MRRKLVLLLLLVPGIVTLAGCGEPIVTGEVTLDGEPLKEGLITYVPLRSGIPNAAAKIENGRYRVKVPVGEMKVQITAPVVMGKRKAYNTPDSPTIDVLGERIPERYNKKTELKAEVKSGANKFNWKLQSK